MSVQVFYKNKAKSSGLGVITIFGDEKFQTKNLANVKLFLILDLIIIAHS